MEKMCYKFSLCEMHLPDVSRIWFYFGMVQHIITPNSVIENVWDILEQNDITITLADDDAPNDRKSIKEAITDLTLRLQNMIIYQFNRIH